MRTLPAVVLMVAGCTPVPSADIQREEPVASAASAAPVTSEAAPEPKKAGAVPCGELGCMQYDTAAEAFAVVLATNPRIVALGEAHAQKGNEGIDSATKRFTEQLLPTLVASTSDIVLELMVPDPSCKKTTAQVEKHVEKPATRTQQDTNKPEFQLLGETAKAAGIRPHVLRPSCKELDKVAAAGDEGVIEMLSLIANLSGALVQQILERNERDKADKRVALYGGAMHNDLQPVAGREAWSYGPRLSGLVSGHYVEVDLIVPEYIKDTDAWKSLPWYPLYDRAKQGGKVTLYNTAAGSYTLIFAASPPH